MALLTNRETEKDLSERLEEFLQFGMVLNYMLEIEKIALDDLEGMFFDSDQEKATFTYSKLLKKIDSNDIEASYVLYSHEYPNTEGLNNDEYSSYLNSNCIRNILNSIIDNHKPLDKTYFNTYDYLLNEEAVRK